MQLDDSSPTHTLKKEIFGQPDFCSDVYPNLQTRQIDTSCRKSEPVCSFEFTDYTENCVVCNGH